MRVSFACTATFGSLLIGIALLELVAWAILPALGEQRGRPFWLEAEHDRCKMDGVDVFFGYAPGECKTPSEIAIEDGLAIMDDPRALEGPSITPHEATYQAQYPGKTVLVLGGSTTDPITMSTNPEIGFDGWALGLARTCQQALPLCRVVNGGRAAFTSAQELLLLVRDGLAFDPDVVVSFNGINEWYFRQDPVMAEHPFVTRHLRNTFRNMCHSVSPHAVARWRRTLPNSIALAMNLRKRFGAKPNIGVVNDEVEGKVGDCLLNLGPALPARERDPAAIWRRNVTSMEALVRARGGRYFAVLQPTLGIGRYQPASGPDAELLAESRRTETRYYEIMDEVYASLRSVCRSLDYCFDLTDLFVDETDVYADPRHPNRRGNALEAAAVWALIAPALVDEAAE